MTNYVQEMWQLAINGQGKGILFWFAIYMLCVCFYSLIFQIRMRYWPFVKGELIEIGKEKFGTATVKSDQNFITKAFYRYTVAGVDYEGTRVSPWLIMVSYNLRFILKKQISYIQRFPDGKVKVFYNPNNPRKSFLIIPGKVGIGITLLFSVLPLILFYYQYYV